jgi:hypothetical protein
LTQLWPAPQSLLKTQAPEVGAGAVTQLPFWQTEPVPQLPWPVQEGWQALFTHSPPAPHSLLKTQALCGVVLGLQEPLQQVLPAAQLAFEVHEVLVD